MRLDKCLANSGYGSRSEVKLLIKSGHVCIGNKVITDPGTDIKESDYDLLSVDGQAAIVKTRVILMMNKPDGYITAMEDERLPTIADLIPHQWIKSKLFPVGRLDRDTTGLLLLTNDGILGHRLTGPRWGVWKTYRVETNGKAFSQDDIEAFSAGLTLTDGAICRPAKLELINDHQADLTIHEGKYHQVKRMMLGTGRRVIKLHRWQIGPILLDNELEPGACRELNNDEIAAVYKAVSLAPDHKEKGD